MINSDAYAFLSYAHEDLPAATQLYRELKSNRIELWFDKVSLLPGQNWEIEITKAIINCGAFLALLSDNSLNKRGYIHAELNAALKVLYKELPPGEIFVIPIRIEDCQVNDDRLKKIQWIDLFRDWETNFTILLKSLEKKGLKRTNATVIKDFHIHQSDPVRLAVSFSRFEIERFQSVLWSTKDYRPYNNQNTSQESGICQLDIKNIPQPEVIERIKGKWSDWYPDVALVDMTFRSEIIKRQFCIPLEWDFFRGIIPENYRVSLKEVGRIAEHFGEKRKHLLCLPIRPNVRLWLVNRQNFNKLKKKSQKLGLKVPSSIKSWQDIKSIAEASNNVFGSPGVAIMAGGGRQDRFDGIGFDSALLILELIWASGGSPEPDKIISKSSLKAMQFLRDLWPSIKGLSLYHTFDTVEARLDDNRFKIIISQAWPYTLARLDMQNRLKEFDIIQELSFDENSSAVAFLGGDCAVIPRLAPRYALEHAGKLLRTLLSEEVQVGLLQNIAWPTVIPLSDELIQGHTFKKETVKALIDWPQSARSTPDWWSYDVCELFMELFIQIVESHEGIDVIANRVQKKLRDT